MSITITQFVSQTLHELADEYQIPKSFITQLTGLIDKYPNLEIRGKKKALRQELEKVIGNLKDQGLLDNNDI